MIALPRRPWHRRYLPGWIVSGGGGSGGASTVQTDGVTIQGDGSAGNKIAIKQVETQARLTGAGTVASKLDIAGWPCTFFTYPQATGFGPTVTANKLILLGFTLDCALTFSQVTVSLVTNDNTNNSDIGLYNSAGTLIANIGAQHTPAGGDQTFAFTQGAQTISPGLYFFAVTSAGSTLNPNGNQQFFCAYFNGTFGTSAGGALPASIAPPALAPSRNGITFCLS